MPVEIDLTYHGDPAGIAAVARSIEEHAPGSALYVPEGAHDAFVYMALAADGTSRIQLGTSIALAFARSPMAMAYPTWDLQRLSGGRFVLGLGSQIKPHIERRFSMPWSRPADRMREYVAALRAIFHTWQTGDTLDFKGDFYTHTLMPPLFNPGPLPAPPPIWLAGVGPLMIEAAGAVADGFMCHPLLSQSYLSEAITPQLEKGRASTGATGDFIVTAMAMVATGRTEEEMAVGIAGTKRQIGFYASTPAYKPVLDHHGWGDLHAEAHAFTKTGRWAELGDLIDDEVLSTLAVVAEMPDAGAAVRARFEGLASRVILSIPYQTDPGFGLEIVTGS
ncbi:TIGR03617 family F420-dependent LLM class oxidoreductase [Nocardioides humilatus]|uniref:TIGR03617 family F420-dependent LLM class oxidoreductase n=1 Tax=Nocardioides humilatus TaxID=2607660 RepID=A0A5B1LG07_9ACTN|nr:TIGR03617 family F420-dependent LLM class oxidoreductase [Nocardioides humilatus]KAA1419284.1 TIGR03617 family F420-dependent LLM class oxidoreductase [Nocardioides humilatus]